MPKLTPVEAYSRALKEIADFQHKDKLETLNHLSAVLYLSQMAEATLLNNPIKAKPKAAPADKAQLAIHREALKLAKAKVKEQLTAKGYDPKTLPVETLVAFAESLLAKDPYFLEEAVKRLSVGAHPKEAPCVEEPGPLLVLMERAEGEPFTDKNSIELAPWGGGSGR